jgi:hypothetical protein
MVLTTPITIAFKAAVQLFKSKGSTAVIKKYGKKVSNAVKAHINDLKVGINPRQAKVKPATKAQFVYRGGQRIAAVVGAGTTGAAAVAIAGYKDAKLKEKEIARKKEEFYRLEEAKALSAKAQARVADALVREYEQRLLRIKAEKQAAKELAAHKLHMPKDSKLAPKTSPRPKPRPKNLK